MVQSSSTRITPAIAPGSQRAPGCGAAVTIATLAAFARDGSRQCGFVLLIRGAETQVDNVRALAQRPVDGAHERCGGRGQLAIEYLDREELRVGCFFSNRRCDCRAVTQPVRVVGMLAAISVDRDSFGDGLHMGMRGVHAAVDDGHAHAASGRRQLR